MATSNRDREVKMTLSVETLGSDEIKKLQTEIQNLGRGAGEASPEFDRLADEIGRLGAQADVLRNFQALGAEVDQLAARQAEAAAQSEKLNAELAQLRDTTTTAAAAQAKAQAEYAQAKSALSDLTGQLTILRNSYDANGDRVANYKAELERLTRAKVEQKVAVEQAKAALDSSNASLDKAEAAEGRKAKAVERSQEAVKSATAAVEKQERAVAAAAKELESLGLSSENIAKAQAELVQSINLTGAAADNAAAQLKEMSAAADFERQATEARKLVQAAEYVQFWEQALKEAEAAQKEAAATETFNKQAAEAQKLVQASEYVRFWEQALKEAEQAQKEAAATATFEKQIADAKQLRQAAEYVQFWEQALQEAERAQVEAAQAASALNSAFNAINLRNVEEVEAELRQVREAMQTIQTQSGLTGSALSAAMAQGNARINELQRELREVTGQLTLADRAAGLFKNSMGQIAAGNLIADGIASLVERVKEMGRAFITVNVQAETMRRALTAIYKDTNVAASQIDFLRASATSAGISVAGIADSFVKFSAATRSSNIPLEQTNALFEAVTRAGSTLGLSTERVQLALDALGQIASKGVVSMEELRQQLGDSLPGALSLTAKGLGITDAELIKLVETGRLASRDFFPALTKGLKDLQGDTDGITQTWGRFKTALANTATTIGDAGWLQVLTGALKVLGGVVGAVAIAFASLAETLAYVGKAAVAVFGLLRGDGAVAMQFLKDEALAASERVNKLADSFDAMLDPTSEAAQRLKASAAASSEMGGAAQDATTQLKASADQLKATSESALQYAKGSEASAAATQVLGNAAFDASAKFVQLGVRLAELADRQEANVIVATKGTKAAKDQAAAIEAKAKSIADETLQMAANTQANELVIAASEREAKARTDLAATLAVELQSKLALAQAEENGLVLRKQELEALAQKVEKANAEADAARKATEAIRARAVEQAASDKREIEGLQQSAAALKAKNDALKDNSDSTETYAAALARAQAELDRMVVSAAQGKTSQEELSRAQERVATATLRASDAFKDQQANIAANTNAAKSAIAVQIEGLQLSLQVVRQQESVAKSLGNETRARELALQAKRIEIQIAELQIQMMRLEAEGSIALAQAKMAELAATNQLTPAKRIELETTIAVANAKLNQTALRERLVQMMRDEANQYEKNASAIDRETGSVNKNSDSWERNAKARSKASGVDADGFTLGTNGQRATTELPTWLSIFNQLKSRGLSEEQARSIAAEFTDSNGNVNYFNNPGQIKYGKGTGMSLNAAVDEAASQVLRNNSPLLPGSQRAGGGAFGGAGSAGGVRSGSNTPATGGGYTVNVNLNGSRTAINTASQRDADALAALLQQLGRGASVAGGG